MANKNLFRSSPRGKTPPPADATTHHGTKAYALSSKQALAQLSATGCFGNTFYADAKSQLDDFLKLCKEVEPQFIAQCAVYSRKFGFMKDAPAFLAAYLAKHDVETLKKVFYTVCDNPKMLRNFVQIIRSGVTGRKSLGTAPKKLVAGWLRSKNGERLFRGSVGNDPSLADVIKMVHVHPRDAEQEATLGYLIGKEVKNENLPQLIRDFEAFKKDPENSPVPSVDFRMLTALSLTPKAWKAIAMNAPWQETRMNLNTFERHGVFKDRDMIVKVAEKLRDEKAISKARVFPYQLLMAYMNYTGEHAIKEALQDAMEIAVQNVPKIEGRVAVAVDVSGSMASPVTGHRAGATSKARCVDVAALFAACVLRKNPDAMIMPFNGDVVNIRVNPRDSIMTNAEKMARLCNNGTNCSSVLAKLNRDKTHADAVIYFSDNESWMDKRASFFGCGNWAGFGPCAAGAPETMNQWVAFKVKNPQAKMVCLDLAPNGTVQAKSDDILNIGGFNDNVFMLIADFVQGKHGDNYWVEQISMIDINKLDGERN